jgi:hypothetical protein
MMVADAVAQYTVNDAPHAAHSRVNPIKQESATPLHENDAPLPLLLDAA